MTPPPSLPRAVAASALLRPVGEAYGPSGDDDVVRLDEAVPVAFRLSTLLG